MENVIFCQSCNMPIVNNDLKGTEKDGSISEDYCIYCYENGEFTSDMTMDEMIDFCFEKVKEYGKQEPDFNEEESLNQMKTFFPQLKRWNKE